MKTMSRFCNQLFVPLPAIPGMISSQVLSILPRWLYIILYRPKCDLLYCGLLFKVKNTNNNSRGKGVQGRPTHPSSHCPGSAGQKPLRRGVGSGFHSLSSTRNQRRVWNSFRMLEETDLIFFNDVLYCNLYCKYWGGGLSQSGRSNGISFKSTQAEDGCWLITGSSAGSGFQ